MSETVRQDFQQDGHRVSISQLRRWFDMPRRTMYYKQTRKTARLQDASANRSSR